MSKKYPYVEIHWRDAVSETGWIDPDKLPKPVDVVSRGWKVVNAEEYITLVSTIKFDDSGEYDELSEALTIPRGMIVEELKLKFK